MLLNDFSDEQVFCSFITEEYERNRAIANILGIKVATDFFKECGLPCSSKTALHKIKSIFKDADIADIYIGNLRLDVRLSLSAEEFYIPKKHFELGITPDLYMLIFYDKTTSKASVCGFINPKEIDKSNFDDYYYYVPKTLIATFEETSKLFDTTISSETVLPPNIKKKILLYLDNQLADKATFYRELANSREARTLLIEALYAKEVLSKTNFTFEAVAATVTTPVEPKEELCDLGFADGLTQSENRKDSVTENETSVDLEEFIEDTNSPTEDAVEEIIVQVQEQEQEQEIEPITTPEPMIEVPVENAVEEKASEGVSFDLDSLTDEPEDETETVLADVETPVFEVSNTEETTTAPEDVINEQTEKEETFPDNMVIDLIELPEEQREEIESITEETVEEVPALIEEVAEETSNVENTLETDTVSEENELKEEEEEISLPTEEIEQLEVTPIEVNDFSEIENTEENVEINDIDLSINENLDINLEDDMVENIGFEEPTVEFDLTEETIPELSIEEEVSPIDIQEEIVEQEIDSVPENIETEESVEDNTLLEQDVLEEEILPKEESELELGLEDSPEALTLEEVSDIELKEPVKEDDLVLEELPEISFDEGNDFQLDLETEEPLTALDDVAELPTFNDESEIPILEEIGDISIDEPPLEEISSQPVEKTAIEYNVEEVEETENKDFIEENVEEIATDDGLSFNEFAEDIKNIDKNSPQPQNISQEEEDEEEEDYNDRFDKYDNLDENYKPDFMPDELSFEGEAKTILSKEPEENTSNSSPLDIQATMEGFVNTIAPEEALNIAHESSTSSVEIQPIVDTDDDSIFEEIAEEDETVSDVEVEYKREEDNKTPKVEAETIQAIDSLYDENNISEQSITNTEEVREEFDDIENIELEQPMNTTPYKNSKQFNPSGIIAGIIALSIVAIGVAAYLNRDAILDEITKLFPSEEPVPNELTTPIETKKVQKVKEHKPVKPKKTEVQELLNDIEEPVQLMDTSVSVAQLSIDCDVPSSLITTYSRRYLVKLAKRTQINLRNALLLANGQPLANKVIADLSIVNDVIKFEKISSSSGSKKVDNITTSTIESILKDTQPYPGTFGKNNGNIRLIVNF